MQDFEARIEQRIQAFARELNVLVREAAVQAVRDALGVPGTTRSPAATPKAKPRKAAKKAPKKAPAEPVAKAPAKPVRRSPRKMAAAMSKVRTHVEASPGQTVEQIGKALGMTTKDLARPIAKLLGDGKLTKTGIKRQTKYFPPEQAPKAAAKKTATKRTTRAPAKKTATKAPAKKRRSKR